jgi:S-adenosylmethionine decarboxylase
VRLTIALVMIEGATAAWLDDPDHVRMALGAAVEAGRFALLETVVHHFEPQGVTAIAVVGESHIALHSWPEEERLFVDVVSCGDPSLVRPAVDALVAAVPGARIVSFDEHHIDPDQSRSSHLDSSPGQR